MKILVTGGTGFLGKALVKRLKEASQNQVYLLKDDLLDLTAIKKTIKRTKPEVVFHLGALVNLSRDYEIASQCVEINIKGTLNLLEALKDIEINRLVFTSTAEVYGSGPTPFKEDQALKPTSVYAITKIAGEHLIQLYGLPYTIFRLSNVIGPGQKKERLIPALILACLKGKDFQASSGVQKRDFLYLDDAVDALTISVKNPKAEGEIINLGGGKQYSVRGVIEKTIQLMGNPIKPVFGAIGSRKGEAQDWICDLAKAKKMLGWEPKTSLEAGLKKTIEYYQRLYRKSI
jgi:nucleoside-diphosphate-sugar epimerase